MSKLSFHHGVRGFENDSGTRHMELPKSSVIGLCGTAPDADPEVFPLNEPVLVLNQPRKAALLDTVGAGRGTLFDNHNLMSVNGGGACVINRVEEGDTIEETISNIVGDPANMTGVHAFLGAGSHVGMTPRICVASGFTSQRPGNSKNPVVSALEGVVNRLRAIQIIDGPGTTDQAAIDVANECVSPRSYLVDPGVKVWDTDSDGYIPMPASAAVAGLIARVDNEKGFWWSPSNKRLRGIGGTTRPIGFQLSDNDSVANYLNENRVASIVETDLLWGNRTTSDDPMHAFLSVRRTLDMIIETIEGELGWSIDRPISEELLRTVMATVQSFLNFLKAQGAILSGKVWLDKELNTKENLSAGKVWLDFDVEPPAPMESLNFTMHRNNGYYEELVRKIAA